MGEYVFKRANQVVTLNSKSTVKVDGDVIHTDPQLFFKRLTLIAKSGDSLEDVFRFELCSYPPALSSSAQFLREAHKPVLADAIWSFLSNQGIPGLPRELHLCLTVGHCFSAFHGQKELLLGRYALCTQSMSQGSMGMQ